MPTQRFEGRNLEDALARACADVGREARVVGAERVRSGGIGGFFARERVEIEVDAYPKFLFHGRIDSISAATGAKFALLPPDNATGNFTKVVQRVPVKIVLTDPPDPVRPLRTGMSVNAIVQLD